MNKKIKKAQTVVYEVGSSLYINVTNRCSNRCDFCIRNNDDGAYGSDSLWLLKEPTESEIFEAIASRDVFSYDELVFCGYGEPTYRLETVRAVSLKLKEAYPSVKIRVNTNGQSNLILGYPTEHLYADAIDSVSISLNAPTAIDYQRICHSVYGEESFEEILKFAKNVKKYVHNVQFSVVKEFISESELEQSYRIANECGITLRVRDYIPADKTSE